MMDLSIIIVNHNSKKLLSDCLSSFFRFRPILSFEIIIVDNASSDNSKSEFIGTFPELIWHDMGYNAGFARANNFGLTIARGRFALLLNADTIFSNNILDDLVAKFDQLGDHVALGVQLLNVDGSTQNSGANFVKGGLNTILQLPYIGDLTRFLAYFFGMKNPNVVDSSDYQRVGWISGAFLCVRMSKLSQSGFLDEDFFLYSEEIEWCSRLNRHGKLAILGDLSIIHIGSGSTQSLTNDKVHNYQNISDKKGRQVLVSNFLRIRKQYGLFWLALIFCFYLLELLVLPLGLLVENILSPRRKLANFSQVIGFYKNMLTLTRQLPAIALGVQRLYKVI